VQRVVQSREAWKCGVLAALPEGVDLILSSVEEIRNAT